MTSAPPITSGAVAVNDAGDRRALPCQLGRRVSLRIPGTCRRCSSFASFFSKISDAFHVLLDPLANHVEGLFLRLGGYLR